MEKDREKAGYVALDVGDGKRLGRAPRLLDRLTVYGRRKAVPSYCARCRNGKAPKIEVKERQK